MNPNPKAFFAAWTRDAPTESIQGKNHQAQCILCATMFVNAGIIAFSTLAYFVLQPRMKTKIVLLYLPYFLVCAVCWGASVTWVSMCLSPPVALPPHIARSSRILFSPLSSRNERKALVCEFASRNN